MSDASPPDRPHGAEPSRPSPQYGVYASPEEQRARIRRPDASVALETGMSPEEVARPAGNGPERSASSAANPRRTADRVITIGLLVYGLITVVTSAFSLIDFPTLATASMRMIGVPGEFTNLAQGRMFGAIAAVALVVGWAVTALASWRRLRAGRIAWWVPLAGAAATYAIVYALLIPAILGDPAFIEYVGSATP